tara:strand:- start:14285 stop:14707 length:423 start_codon:yes stop_codon:yes gene_type:complete
LIVVLVVGFFSSTFFTSFLITVGFLVSVTLGFVVGFFLITLGVVALNFLYHSFTRKSVSFNFQRTFHTATFHNHLPISANHELHLVNTFHAHAIISPIQLILEKLSSKELHFFLIFLIFAFIISGYVSAKALYSSINSLN